MADEDLYGDLPVVHGGDAVEPPFQDLAHAIQPDAQVADTVLDGAPGPEALALANVADAIKSKDEQHEDLSADGAFTQIAEALGMKDSSPSQVLAAFSQLASQTQQPTALSIQERASKIADQVQIANLVTEVMELRRRLADSSASTQPDAIHLASLHCDPAIAREFELLKSENAKLNQVNSQLRSSVAASHFKPTDDKGRKLVDKLHAAQDEARALEAQLQARDESLAQAHMHAQQACDLRDACRRQQTHCQQLELTIEDLVSSAASLAKTGGRHGAWQLRVGGRHDDVSRGGRGGARRGEGGYGMAADRRGENERGHRGYRSREGRSGGSKRHMWAGQEDRGGGRRRML